MAMDYKSAGVDTDLADKFVDRIKRMVGTTHDERVVAGVGGFAALYRLDDERMLAASTDGVGTKLKLAIELNIHDTIGIDLVAMCVNDLLCTGARPLFFLDYFASAKLDISVGEAIIKGIVVGCQQGRMALIGGETAEMPGMYAPGDYDLAGFAVGEVKTSEVLDGSQVAPGQTLIALPSSGFHSNGYSLVRRLLEVIPPEQKPDIAHQVLTPTRIYVDVIMGLRKELGAALTGMANITGSGLLNIPRMNPKLSYHVDSLPMDGDLPPGMAVLTKASKLSVSELARTFNMGIGFVLATFEPQKALSWLHDHGERAWVLGKVGDGKAEAVFLGQEEL